MVKCMGVGLWKKVKHGEVLDYPLIQEQSKRKEEKKRGDETNSYTKGNTEKNIQNSKQKQFKKDTHTLYPKNTIFFQFILLIYRLSNLTNALIAFSLPFDAAKRYHFNTS
jgi:hypothetical protein